MNSPEEQRDLSAHQRISAIEGTLHAHRDWLKSIETAINTVSNEALTEMSPAWIGLKNQVDSQGTKLQEVSKRTERVENALTGSYDDSGTVWRAGVRERVDSIWAGLKWLAALGTAILCAMGAEGLNQVFGWWGSAAAAKQIITGGH